MTRLTLMELRAKPPSIREKLTKGTIWIPFPRGMKRTELRVKPMNDAVTYFWDVAHQGEKIR